MKHIPQLTKTLLASSLSAAMLSLTACGGGGSDSGSTKTFQMSGAVVDDYVAFARVYVDVNNNGKFDPSFEPYATTDADGYFSVSKSGKNYCALSPKDFDYKYCLEANESLKNGGIIRVEEGRDLLTTQVYNSVMSLVMNGDSNGLKVTALTTSVEALKNPDLIKTATAKLGLNATDIANLQTKFATYLSGYLSPKAAPTNARYTPRAAATLDVNRINPLQLDNTKNVVTQTDRAFKLAIQIHKLAESIAAKIAPNLSTLDNGVTIYLKPKDVVLEVYFALLNNMPMDSTSDAFSLKQTTGALDLNKVMSDAVILVKALHPKFASLITTPATTNYTKLTKYLNCTLSNSSDTTISKASLATDYNNNSGDCKTILTTDNTNARNKLYAAELGTKAVIDTTNSLNTNTLDNSQKVAESGTATTFVNDNDFTEASKQVNAGNSATSPVKSFTPELTVFKTKHFNLSKNNTTTSDKFKIYLDTKSSGTQTPYGDVVVCQKDSTGKNNLFKGQWHQDPQKPYILYASYLNIPVTIKQLDNSGGAYASCNGLASCLTVSYQNVGADAEANPVKSQTFSAAGSLASSTLLAAGGTPPSSAATCFP